MSEAVALRSFLKLVGKIVTYLIIYAGAAFCLLPLLWMVSASTKPHHEIFAVPIRWLPQQPAFWDNVVAVFQRVPFALYYFNSIVVSVTATALALFFCSLAGYSFAKFNYRGRNVLFLFVLATMMVPFQAVVVPLFVLVRNLGWSNTYQGLIIPGAITSFGVFLMRQFALTLPSEIMDAARVDGASEPRIFWSIVLPMSKPALGALAIFSFLEHWNSFFWPLVIVNQDRYRTLSLGLSAFQTEYGTRYNELMTASLLAAIPVIIIFLAFQKHFVRGVVTSGIKG